MPTCEDVNFGVKTCATSHLVAASFTVEDRGCDGGDKIGRKEGEKQLVQSAAVTESGRLPERRGRLAVAVADGPCAEGEHTLAQEARGCQDQAVQ